MGDENRVRQIVANLVTNGIKYAPPHTAVTICGSWPGRELEVSVDRSGARHRRRGSDGIFDEFTRRPDASRVRGWDWPSPASWPPPTAARSTSRARRVPAPPSRCGCRPGRGAVVSRPALRLAEPSRGAAGRSGVPVTVAVAGRAAVDRLVRLAVDRPRGRAGAGCAAHRRCRRSPCRRPIARVGAGDRPSGGGRRRRPLPRGGRRPRGRRRMGAARDLLPGLRGGARMTSLGVRPAPAVWGGCVRSCCGAGPRAVLAVAAGVPSRPPRHFPPRRSSAAWLGRAPAWRRSRGTGGGWAASGWPPGAGRAPSPAASTAASHGELDMRWALELAVAPTLTAAGLSTLREQVASAPRCGWCRLPVIGRPARGARWRTCGEAAALDQPGAGGRGRGGSARRLSAAGTARMPEPAAVQIVVTRSRSPRVPSSVPATWPRSRCHSRSRCAAR